MTAHHTPGDLTLWLDEATCGLPANVKRAVRAEIEAHYEDAVQEYLARGKNREVAHRAALAELGASAETARALRSTYHARREYIAAMILGMLFPVNLWIGFAAADAIPALGLSFIVWDAIVMIPTFYLLYALRKLLAQRLYPGVLDVPLSLFVGGVIVGDGLSSVMQTFLDQTTGQVWYHVLWNAPIPEAFLLALAIAGMFASGIGLVWMAAALNQVNDSLHGIRRALQVLVGVSGLSILAFSASIVVNNLVVAQLANVLMMLTHLLIMALLALFFFRVVYRPSRRTAQMV